MWKKSGYSVHHIIPTGVGWPNIPENKVTIKDTKHVHHHAIFNADSPAMQLMDVIEFNKKIWNKKFIEDLLEVLENHMYSYYNIEVDIQEEIGKLLMLEKTILH